MNDLLKMGGGDAQSDWPERDPDQRPDPDEVEDPDTDPNLTDDDEKHPGVPQSDPEPRI